MARRKPLAEAMWRGVTPLESLASTWTCALMRSSEGSDLSVVRVFADDAVGEMTERRNWRSGRFSRSMQL